jgi:hypothetical protein
MHEEQEREVMKLVELYGEECARVEYLSHTDSLRPMHELEKAMALETVSEALASLAKPQPVGGAPVPVSLDSATAAIHQACKALIDRSPDSTADLIRLARDASIDAVLRLATLSAPVAQPGEAELSAEQEAAADMLALLRQVRKEGFRSPGSEAEFDNLERRIARGLRGQQ